MEVWVGSSRMTELLTIFSAEMMRCLAARASSMSATEMPLMMELPYMSASWTWMATTSGQQAGTAAYFLPVNGHSMTLAADILKVSVPRSCLLYTSPSPRD